MTAPTLTKEGGRLLLPIVLAAVLGPAQRELFALVTRGMSDARRDAYTPSEDMIWFQAELAAGAKGIPSRPPAVPSGPFVSVAAAAVALQVSTRRVLALVAQGDLRSVQARPGGAHRIVEADVVELVNRKFRGIPIPSDVA